MEFEPVVHSGLVATHLRGRSMRKFKLILNSQYVSFTLPHAGANLEIKPNSLGFQQIQLTENLTENEAFYSRSYVPELACQFREEELIMRIKLNGAGIQVGT